MASPIGNLEDFTLRAIRVLNEVDLIFCEDTRVTKKLLRHYEITKPLFRYIDDDSKINFYRDKLKSNDIALITDAGTPLLSDPGYKLINIARQNNIDVTSIPGSSALMTAVSLSGRKMNNFIFEGFFSKKSNDQLILSSRLRYRTKDTFLFESPKRIKSTLNFFQAFSIVSKHGIIRSFLICSNVSLSTSGRICFNGCISYRGCFGGKSNHEFSVDSINGSVYTVSVHSPFRKYNSRALSSEIISFPTIANL